MEKFVFLYELWHSFGNGWELETTINAKNIKDAWRVAEVFLCRGDTTFKSCKEKPGNVTNKNTTIKRRYNHRRAKEGEK
jgi:hypothetical protein